MSTIRLLSCPAVSRADFEKLDFFGSLDRFKATKGLFVTASHEWHPR